MCDERGDIRYLQRHLLVLGQAAMRLGEAGHGAAALQRVRAIERENGISDPTVVAVAGNVKVVRNLGCAQFDTS